MAYGEYHIWNHGTIVEADKNQVGQALDYVARKLEEARIDGDIEAQRNYLAERQRFQHGLGRRGLTALVLNADFQPQSSKS
jgi:hypothetical protein